MSFTHSISQSNTQSLGPFNLDHSMSIASLASRIPPIWCVTLRCLHSIRHTLHPQQSLHHTIWKLYLSAHLLGGGIRVCDSLGAQDFQYSFPLEGLDRTKQVNLLQEYCKGSLFTNGIISLAGNKLQYILQINRFSFSLKNNKRYIISLFYALPIFFSMVLFSERE